ncbi:MAG: uroporphyrinogen decarboxylase family protein [Treponema sp.]|nr:uroporphyrinogen decarboxylase family protein [Treponema sp.]
MSYHDGWAALHLQMPDRVPRTEYSLEFHSGLIRHLTGVDINSGISPDEKRKAKIRIQKALNFDFIWSTLTSKTVFEGRCTDMGHGVYQENNADYRRQTSVFIDDPDTALRFDPWELYGEKDRSALTKEYNDHYERNIKANDEAVNMTGIYITCISGLIDIFGWDMLLTAAGTDPQAFGSLTDRYASWIFQYFEALAESKAPVVMIHDDIVWTAGAFIHPDWYRRFVFPNYKRLFAPLHEAGKIIMFTSDGNFTEFIDDIAGCGINAFVMEPMTDMARIAEKYGSTHAFVGNADTRILLSGSREAIRAEVKRCMDIGKKCPGFFMAVGNHIPPNTPLDNLLYYNDVYTEMSKR